MRLRHIEVINAIRVTGTLSAAAQLLTMTQPAVSQILQSAERQLGYPLFSRIKGRLAPTHEALLLFPEMQKLDLQLDAVKKMASNLKEGTAYGMRIIAAPSLAQTIVPVAIAALQREAADLRASMRSDYSLAATASLALLEADIGILYYTPDHPGIETVELGMSHFVVVGPANWMPDARNIALEQLVGHKLIGPDPNDQIGKLFSQALESHGLNLDVRITCPFYHGLIALVEHTHGIGIVDSISATSALDRGLRVLPIYPKVGIPIVASRPNMGRRSIYVEKLITRCREQVILRSAAI
jgi:DNA-binding transcriptional LysR family regulator